MDTSKIIKGVVNSGRYTVTTPIVKEDYGLYLQIEGVELPSTYEVDFSNSEHSGTSVTMIGNADGVLIPHQFIDTGKDIFAFLYHVGANYGRTVYKFRIPNKVRPDRTEDTPTPEEQSVIDQAISALNEAVAQTAQDVIDADASAQSASADADRAEQAKEDASTFAQRSANSAQASADYSSSAQASATASAQSASEAETARQATTSLVAEAQRYADASAQSASASANSASQAQGFAQSASASAQSASTSASAALTYANTASQKATEASTSAQTASTKATEASQSAENALSYKTDTESAKTASQTAQTASESARDSAIQAKTDAESAKADAESARDEAQQAVASISGALAEKAPIITDTASGSIASFTDGADDLPLKSLIVDINPIQDLSNGDPSPTNICPISGWTETIVAHAGSNLWNPVPNGMAKWNPSIGEQIPSLTTNFTTFANDVLSVNTNWEWNGNAFITNKLLTGRTYKVTGIVNSNSNRARIGVYTLDAKGCVVRIVKYVTDNGNMDASVTMGASDVRICVSVANATDNEAVTITNPCISESGIYEPYNGTSITIPLGQTVYGAKLYPLEGKALINMAMVTFDGTESGWQWYEGYKQASISLTESAKYNASKLTYICNVLNPVANPSRPSNIGNFASLISSGASAAFSAPSNTLDEFKAFAQANPIQFCYELATPIEIQLSANQINSLYGVNNLWADSGDTEAVYRADTKLYIDKKIAEAISALS